MLVMYKVPSRYDEGSCMGPDKQISPAFLAVVLWEEAVGGKD